MDHIRKERGNPECVQLPKERSSGARGSEDFIEDTIDERDTMETKEERKTAAFENALDSVRRHQMVPKIRVKDHLRLETEPCEGPIQTEVAARKSKHLGRNSSV